MGSFSNKFLFLQSREVTHVPSCSSMDVCKALHSNDLKSTRICCFPAVARVALPRAQFQTHLHPSPSPTRPGRDVVPCSPVPTGTVLLSSACRIQPVHTCCLRTLHHDPPHLSGKRIRWEYTSPQRQSHWICPVPFSPAPRQLCMRPRGSEEEQNHSGSMTAHDRKAIAMFFASAR